jgi:hypothetical protein
VAELPECVGFSYRDERGERCPTGEAGDERYHVPFDLDAGQGRWRIDLSVFLRAPELFARWLAANGFPGPAEAAMGTS